MARKEAWPLAPLFGLVLFALSLIPQVSHGQATRVAPSAKPARGPNTPRAAKPQAAPAATTRAAATPGDEGVPQVIVAGGQPDSNIAAVVNGEPISRDELAQECLRRFGKVVIEGEINKYLIRQECQKKNVQITDKEIDDEVARTAAGLRLTPERFYEVMRDERQISREQYRTDIVWPMLALKRLAADKLVVSKVEMQQAIESEFGPKVQVRMISVGSAEKAAKLHAQASQNPGEFERLATEHSDDPNTAAARGLVPPISKHVGYPEIEQVAFAMKPGDVSQVISIANQHLILKCERHIPATTIPEDQRPVIAKEVEQRLRENKLRSVGSDMFKVLQEQAKVVNVLNDPELQKQLPGVAATINGGQIMLKDLAEQCLIRHGTDVLDGEINRKMLQQAMRRRSVQVTREDIDAEIERAASTFGFADKDGKVDKQAWLKQVTSEGNITVDLYVRDVVWPSVALKKLVTTKIEVTDDDLQKGFAANYGERVEVLAIVMNDQRTAHEVFKLARDNNNEKFFGELAHQYSVEPVSRANYGQVPPIRRFGGQPMLEEEAFKLKPGDISGVLAIGETYILLRCLGFTKPVIEDINVVREELSRDITEKKMRLAMTKEYDALKEGAQIDNFLARTSQAPGDKSAVRAASHAAPAVATPGQQPRPERRAINSPAAKGARDGSPR